MALPENAKVTARVQYSEEQDSIFLLLCGSEHCSEVQLWGEREDRTLLYWTVTGCDLRGWDGCSLYSVSPPLRSAACRREADEHCRNVAQNVFA